MSMHSQSLTPILALLGAVTLPGAADAACTPSSPPDIVGWSRQASEAFANMDALVFGETRGRVLSALDCLTAAPTPAEAAALHEAAGLGWFQIGNETNALDAFRAMYAADPSWSVSANVAPAGGPLYTLLERARGAAPSARVSWHPWPGWQLSVDGQPQDSLPSERSAIIALVDPLGRVAWSGLLAAGAQLPNWLPTEPLRLNDETLSTQEPPSEVIIAKSSHSLLAATGGATLVAASLWTATALDVRAYNALNGQASDTELDLRYARVNGLAGAALATSGVAVVLGAGWLFHERPTNRAFRLAVSANQVGLAGTW